MSHKRYKKVIESYGITVEEYTELNNKQFFRCAICFGTSNNNARLSIDHCHDTNLVRGLLCNTCNLGLGYFKDDIAKLEGAIAYLKEFEYKKDKLLIEKARHDLQLANESYFTRVI